MSRPSPQQVRSESTLQKSRGDTEAGLRDLVTGWEAAVVPALGLCWHLACAATVPSEGPVLATLCLPTNLLFLLCAGLKGQIKQGPQWGISWFAKCSATSSHVNPASPPGRHISTGFRSVSETRSRYVVHTLRKLSDVVHTCNPRRLRQEDHHQSRPV